MREVVKDYYIFIVDGLSISYNAIIVEVNKLFFHNPSHKPKIVYWSFSQKSLNDTLNLPHKIKLFESHAFTP